jgi:RsiW-degrading membrane proteinase PrsW (M82 family)
MNKLVVRAAIMGAFTALFTLLFILYAIHVVIGSSPIDGEFGKAVTFAPYVLSVLIGLQTSAMFYKRGTTAIKLLSENR